LWKCSKSPSLDQCFHFELPSSRTVGSRVLLFINYPDCAILLKQYKPSSIFTDFISVISNQLYTRNSQTVIIVCLPQRKILRHLWVIN
jgi:hypothetical protein